MKKFINLFWAVLATLVIINEFFIGQIEFIGVEGKRLGTWVLVGVWSLIAFKNYYSLFTSPKKVS